LVEELNMRLVVFARPVQNPAVRIESGAARVLDELVGYDPIPNPMDEMGLEVALRLREKARLKHIPSSMQKTALLHML